MKLFYLLFIFLFVLSCSDDDFEVNSIEPIDNFKIEKYHGFYAQYNSSLSLDPNHDNLIKFEYNQENRIKKRIGDVLQSSPFSGLGLIISDSLYTDLTYYDNKVHIEKKVTPFSGFGIPQNESIITFDDDNRMLQKIRTYQSNYGLEIDTTNYTYENNKLISYIKTSIKENSDWNNRYFEESELYYNNDNLDSIVTLYSYKINIYDYTVLQKKETKLFSGYDTAKNPFRKLQIFEETFNRSLSKNNFTQYKVTSNGFDYPNYDFYQTPIVLSTVEETFQTWSFAYDENGEWLYNHF